MLSRPDRDDLNQEAEIAAWKAESTYRPGPVPLAKWKALKALGARRDYARTWTGSRRSTKYVEMPLHLSTPAFRLPDIELQRAMESLPTINQRVMWMSYWLGLSNVEIAREIGYNYGSVAQLIGKTLELLRRNMGYTVRRSRKAY